MPWPVLAGHVGKPHSGRSDMIRVVNGQRVFRAVRMPCVMPWWWVCDIMSVSEPQNTQHPVSLTVPWGLGVRTTCPPACI